jgi:hypothetical protein
VIISGLQLKCPKCGKTDQFSTADFHVPEVTEAPPSGGRGTAQENLSNEHEATKEAMTDKLGGAGVIQPESRSPREGGS